jgi:hypothetical protein
MRRLAMWGLVALGVGLLSLAFPALAATDDDIPGVPLALGATVSGSTSSGDVNDVYAVSLNEGQEVHITCDPGSTSGTKGTFHLLVPGATLLSAAADWTEIAYTLSGGSFFRFWADFDYTPAKSGTYYLWVEWKEGSLNYQISVTRTSRPAITTPDAGDIPGTKVSDSSVDGVVSSRADRDDVYAVDLTAGRPLHLELVATGGSFGSAYLRLLTPGSQSVRGRYTFAVEPNYDVHEAVNWDSESKPNQTGTMDYTPTSSGTYYIWVLAGNDSFPYRLTVEGSGSGSTTTTTGPPTTTTTTTPGQTPAFVDVSSSHSYYAAIQGMAAGGIIGGYQTSGGVEFRPSNPLWRAQFAKMVCETMDMPVSEDLTSDFTDLGDDDPNNLYPNEYVAAAASNGITTGISPGLFAPYGDITRAQVVTMIVRAAKNLRPDALNDPPSGYTGVIPPFSDIHSPNLRIAEYNGLLDGLQGFEPVWDPWEKAARGEVAQMLWNLLRKLE